MDTDNHTDRGSTYYTYWSLRERDEKRTMSDTTARIFWTTVLYLISQFFCFLRVDWQRIVLTMDCIHKVPSVSPIVPVTSLFGQRKVSWRRCQSRSLWSPSHSSPGPGQHASCLWLPWIPKISTKFIYIFLDISALNKLTLWKIVLIYK